MQFGQPENLNWLWWVTLIVLVVIVVMVRHQAARRAFASRELLRRMTTVTLAPRIRALVLTTLALIGIVIGLVDIRWGRAWREVPQRGIEVMFVLDVSRSMLAQDVSPNRLERSKQYIKDMIQEMAGDRVGLVVFAGDVKKQIPLTNHYGDFSESLNEISPQNIDRGGSNLAKAIEVASRSFLDKTSDHRAIVLFTDGEFHENEPVEMAKRAFEEQGTRIFTVGIGDSDSGARIPTPNRQRGPGETFLQYDGETVMSKQNSKVLERVALSTDGAYIPAGTKHVDMTGVYHRFVANIEERDFDTARIHAFVPRYQWFLGFSLLMLVVDVLLSSRNPSRPVGGRAEDDATLDIPPSLAAGIVLCLALGIRSTAIAQETANNAAPTQGEASPEQLVQQGQWALRQGDMATALERFQAAEAQGFVDPRMSYNQGIAHYNQGDTQAAREAFAAAATSKDPKVAGNALFNLGNTHYADAVQQLEQDPTGAMASLQQAIDHYRGAVAYNRGDRDARANIELADRLRRQLNQQPQQQPQQNQTNNSRNQADKSDQQEQSGEQDPDQNQDGEKSQDQEDAKNQAEEQSSDQQQGSDSAENQESTTNETDSQQRPSNPQPLDDAVEPDEQQTSNGDAQPGKDEPPTEGELEASNDFQNATEAPESQTQGPPMTMQEARKLLQAVRDRELRNRLQQLQRMRPRRIPVDKDW